MGLVFLIVLAGGCIAAFYYFSEGARTKRALRKAPKCTIAQFPEHAAAKIVGTLTYRDTPLVSPLTGRHCAYYQIVVEEQRSNGKNSYWAQLIREVQGIEFQIEDQSGTAIVDPTGATIAINVDSHTKSGTFDDATPLEQAFLERHGKESQGWVFNKSIRYKEGVLEAGEPVAALGRGTKEPDPDGAQAMQGYRDGPPMRLRLRASQNAPLLLSDEWDSLQ